jgi:hypothetical protein
MRKFLLGLFLAGTAGAYSAPAHAFNSITHERLPDQAYQTMNILRRGEYLSKKVSAVTGLTVAPLSARPASVPASQQAKWDKYIAELRLAPLKLDRLRTGLANPRKPVSGCPMYPVLAANAKLADCRLGDIPFAPKRGWATNDSDCFVRRYFAGDSDAPEFFDDLPSNHAGAMLGLWGQQVDDEMTDTMLWIRPTNTLFIAEFKAVLEDLTEYGLAIAFAPFACLAALFSGSNCLDDARSAAHDVNPVTEIDEWAAEIEKSFIDSLPVPFSGIDGDDMFDMTGLWHFINVERGDGSFNDIGGMHYTHGGWRGGAVDIAGIGRIDSMDYAIILGTDLIGLTVDADNAGGVKRYQQSPDGPLNRRKGDWLLSLGHTEFEPLDNLALYGWRRFQRDHDVSGLGWVLHAIGDSVEPHHGVAATGWGHRPFEEFTAFAWNEMLSESGVNHYFSMQRALEQGFSWWSYLDDAQLANPSDLPIRDLVTNLAYTTRASSDWALHNGVSVEFLVDGTEERARDIYGGDADKVRGQVEMGIGATLAFLAKASQFAVDEPSKPSPCVCAPGTARGIDCLDGITVCTGSPLPIRSQCEACSKVSQVEAGGRCVQTCPADAPLLNSAGHCEATCTAPPCTGFACADSSAFLESNGATPPTFSCVAQCSSAHPFAVGRECKDVCPPGTVATATSPAFCETEPQCRATSGRRDVNGICDEHCPTGFKFIEDRVCVNQCTKSFFQAHGQFSDCLDACDAEHPFTLNGATAPMECFSSCPAQAPYNVIGATKCYTSCPAGWELPSEAGGSTCYPVSTEPPPT